MKKRGRKSRFSNNDVIDIFLMLRSGLSRKQVASRYNVTYNTIFYLELSERFQVLQDHMAEKEKASALRRLA